jgi:hypothetical protein
MVAAIAARSGVGTIVEAKHAVHIDVTGADAYVPVVPVGTITAIDIANPGEITIVGHGLVNGDVVTIAGTDSTPVLDGTDLVVSVIDVDKFSVDAIEVTGAGTEGTVDRTADADGRLEGVAKQYTIVVDAPAAVDDAVSVPFSPSSDGKWTWDGYIFPADGTYDLNLVDLFDDSTVATVEVVVNAVS